MKLNKKLLVLLVCVTLLLTCAVSGTVAYLADMSGPVENQFKPTEVDTEIDEVFENNVKSSIAITNVTDENHIPVYVRVAVVGNWVKDGKIVEAWSLDSSYINKTDWLIGGDGYYYYRKVLAVGATTKNLLNDQINTTAREDGAHLEVTVIHQSIQSEPETTVESVWNVTVTDGSIVSQP